MNFKCKNCGNDKFTIPFLASEEFDLLEKSDNSFYGYYTAYILVSPEARIVCTKCKWSSLVSVHDSINLEEYILNIIEKEGQFWYIGERNDDYSVALRHLEDRKIIKRTEDLVNIIYVKQ
jgi:hypothetical protein